MAAAKTQKREPIPFDPAQLIDRHGAALAVYAKQVPFDHETIPAVAYLLALRTPDGLRTTAINSYSGCLTAKTAAALESLDRGVLVADPEKYLAELIGKRGYRDLTPAPADPAKARRGRPRKSAE